jgi:hypothetical protein
VVHCGACSDAAGQPPSPLARMQTSAGATLQQALRGPLLPTPPAAMPLLGGGSSGGGAFQLPPQLPPQLAALLASAAGGDTFPDHLYRLEHCLVPALDAARLWRLADVC